MSNRLFDIFPAKIEPWPEGLPQIRRIRVVGFPEGLVILHDPGGSNGVQRMDVPSGDYKVTRDGGCPSCGARRLRQEQVTGVNLPEPEPEPETKPKRRPRKKAVEPVGE